MEPFKLAKEQQRSGMTLLEPPFSPTQFATCLKVDMKP